MPTSTLPNTESPTIATNPCARFRSSIGGRSADRWERSARATKRSSNSSASCSTKSTPHGENSMTSERMSKRAAARRQSRCNRDRPCCRPVAAATEPAATANRFERRIAELEEDRYALQAEVEFARNQLAEQAKQLADERRRAADERADWANELRLLREAIHQQMAAFNAMPLTPTSRASRRWRCPGGTGEPSLERSGARAAAVAVQDFAARRGSTHARRSPPVGPQEGQAHFSAQLVHRNSCRPGRKMARPRTTSKVHAE